MTIFIIRKKATWAHLAVLVSVSSHHPDVSLLCKRVDSWPSEAKIFNINLTVPVSK